MQMNQLTPEKDWVAKVNENFTKLSADVQRSTAFVGKNGWSVSSNSFVLKIPCLGGDLKVLHIEAENSASVPGQGTDILTVPQDYVPSYNIGYINDPIDETGHDGGYMSMYFIGSTLSSTLKAMDGHTNAHNVELKFTILYF